ncbi:TetR/AcrR family transcriptional regulator [Mycolicibacterium mengxianglii]|uniref:TetR/AcrR family transcriptional regulator n=1 Tax=Mycolicibacterium mengxianglii TaxID=2736649 RepID=UPI0018EEDDA7|nr:TetR/AcrR family transcriptional regulator [Mycolicibacterium mengxianglii]
MAARAHSTDPRAERVRCQLQDAALQLAGEGPVDGLTVGAIARRASVSRQAFYQHFDDRDDAVGAAVAAAFATATAGIGADPADHILALFDFVARHRAIYRNIVPSTVSSRAASAFRAELAPACREIAAQATTSTAVTTDQIQRFLVGGFMEVLRSWMEDPNPGDLHVSGRQALDTVAALLGIRRAVAPA